MAGRGRPRKSAVQSIKAPLQVKLTKMNNVKFDESSLPCRMDKKIHRAICFNKDDGESGGDEDGILGILGHESWQEIKQFLVTADMRKKALRAHHIYDLKQPMGAKNHAIVNGKR